MPEDVSHLTADWPGTHALAVAKANRVLAAAGDLDAEYRIASITKLFTCYAALIALEEGTIELDDEAGPAGSTVRHLMAHASGLGFNEHRQLAPAGERRIYSNTGIEALATHIEIYAGMAFDHYLFEGVLEPLGLTDIDPSGSPAHGLHMSLRSLLVFANELLAPTLIAPSTLAMATTPTWPELRGVLPGFGAMDQNLWGLGFEIRGTKDPHWTAPLASPATFGHFGGAGSFLWVDPDRGLVGATVGDVEFGDWAVEAWAPANAALLERYG